MIERVDPKTNKIFVRVWGYGDSKHISQRRSYSYDEFITFLTTPELFEEKVLNFRKKFLN